MTEKDLKKMTYEQYQESEFRKLEQEGRAYKKICSSCCKYWFSIEKNVFKEDSKGRWFCPQCVAGYEFGFIQGYITGIKQGFIYGILICLLIAFICFVAFFYLSPSFPLELPFFSSLLFSSRSTTYTTTLH